MSNKCCLRGWSNRFDSFSESQAEPDVDPTAVQPDIEQEIRQSSPAAALAEKTNLLARKQKQKRTSNKAIPVLSQSSEETESSGTEKKRKARSDDRPKQAPKRAKRSEAAAVEVAKDAIAAPR